MRKTLGIFLCSSLALWLGGCGDDGSEDACEGTCAEPDAEPTGTDDDETSSSLGSSSAETSSKVEDAGVNDLDAGTSSVLPDGSSDTLDGSLDGQSDAEVTAGDGGATADADAAPGEQEGDAVAPDASSLGTSCDQACATAAEAGCEDNTSCATNICSNLVDSPPECDDEADAYLLCVADADPETDFVCEGDQPTYSGTDCLGELIVVTACLNLNQ